MAAFQKVSNLSHNFFSQPYAAIEVTDTTKGAFEGEEFVPLQSDSHFFSKALWNRIQATCSIIENIQPFELLVRRLKRKYENYDK